MAHKFIDERLSLKGEDRLELNTHTHEEEGHAKMEKDIGVIQLQAKK